MQGLSAKAVLTIFDQHQTGRDPHVVCYQDQAVTCQSASKLWDNTEPAAVSQAQTTWWASGACHCLGPSLRRHLVRLHWPASVTEGWKLHSSQQVCPQAQNAAGNPSDARTPQHIYRSKEVSQCCARACAGLPAHLKAGRRRRRSILASRGAHTRRAPIAGRGGTPLRAEQAAAAGRPASARSSRRLPTPRGRRPWRRRVGLRPPGSSRTRSLARGDGCCCCLW